MIKKYKIILSVLLVLLVVTGVVTVTGVLDINRIVKLHEEKQNTELVATYKDTFISFTDANSPLLKTDIDNLYYAMDTKGNVAFYSLKDGVLTEEKETGSFEVSAVCSGQTIPAVIHYIEKDGKTAGYGLYTNAIYEGVYLYDYAFFKVTDMFPDFSGKSSLLMMLDVDKTRFYNENKVYSEIFRLYSDHSCEYFLSENQRIPDMQARMRTDYKMFTDDILDQTGNVLFFSSRYYNEGSAELDIISSGGSGENIDNVQYVKGVYSLHMWEKDGKLYYFEKSDVGFNLISFDGKDTSPVKPFEGSLDDDYIISGEYLLEKSSGEIYHITDGSTKQLNYDNFKKNFSPDMFTVSKNGKYCVIRGSNTRNRPVIGLADLTTGKMTDYQDDVFGYVATLNVADDGSVIVSVTTGDSASSYYQLTGVIGKKQTATQTDGAAE